MSKCIVSVAEEVTGEIAGGLLVLLGVAGGDGVGDADYLADKVANLRIFPDQDGRMNLSVRQIGGGLMVVSQFTLLGDCRKGRRPSFTGAASPEKAGELYRRFIEDLERMGLEVRTGIFGAMMEVELVNTGPVTLVIDSGDKTDGP